MIALYFEPISNLKSTHPNNFDNTFKMRVQPRPQGLLLDDFQNGVEEKALGTRLNARSFAGSRALLSSGPLSRVRKVRSCQEGGVNTSDLTDPMIIAIMTSRRKKRSNAQNFRKWRRRLLLKQRFKADFSNHSSFKWYCIWIT